jgi:hypothetical protein
MENEELYMTGLGDGEPYLGDPSVVGGLVSQFCTNVHELLRGIASGALTRDQFRDGLEEYVEDNAAVLLGESGEYSPVKGWNTAAGVGAACRVALGEFWEKSGASYASPVHALFGWLAASVVSAAQTAQVDPDMAGADMQARMLMATRTLLGVQAAGRG